MTFFFFFKLLGDLALLYAGANSILLMAGCNIPSYLPLIVLSSCGTLGFALNQKKPWLRFLALLPMPLALYPPMNMISRLAVLFTCIYVALHIILRRFELSHEERVNFFSIGWKALIVFLLPRLIIIPIGEQGPAFIPYVLIFAVSTLYLTQTLRHDTTILCQTKFRLISIGFLALLLLTVGFVGSPVFTSMVISAVKLFYHWIIAPVLFLLACLVGGFFWILSKIVPISSLHVNEALTMWDLFNFSTGSEMPEVEAASNSQMLNMVAGTIFGIIVLTVLTLFCVNRLKKWKTQKRASSVKETRTIIQEHRSFQEAAPADLIEPKEPRAAVRYYYRRFLKMCKRIGVPIEPYMDSSTVEIKARQEFPGESAGDISNIRNTYIRARYSDQTIGKEDVSKIKEDYQKVKQESHNLELRM